MQTVSPGFSLYCSITTSDKAIDIVLALENGLYAASESGIERGREERLDRDGKTGKDIAARYGILIIIV